MIVIFNILRVEISINKIEIITVIFIIRLTVYVSLFPLFSLISLWT